MKEFEEAIIEHISRTENTKVDILSKVANNKGSGQLSTII